MAQKRASQSLLAIPGAGKRQANFTTPMASADISYLFPDTARTFYKFDQTREDILDCSGQELYSRLLTGEIGDLSVAFDATPKIIALLAAYGLGVAAAPGVGAAVAAVAQLTAIDLGTIGATLTVGGVTYTIVASGAAGSQINIGTTPATFAANIAAKVTTDTLTTLCTATASGATVTFTRNTAGIAGNGAPFSTTDPDLVINQGFVGGAAAGAQVHSITELPFDSYQPPVFSAVFGFRGGATPLLLTGCALNSFSLAGKARQKVTGQANIKFATATSFAFAFPACVNESPLRFSDTRLSADGVGQDTLLRSWDFSYDNKLLTTDHAYTNAGINPTRLERDDRRERKINYSILGDNADPAYIAAQTGDQAPLVLTLGSDPNAVVFTAPNAQLELDGGGLAKDGAVGETNIKIAGMPMMSGVAMPLSASAINAQATAYLLVSP